MAQYKISGVWKSSQGTITHYAMHEVSGGTIYRGVKTAKADAVRRLSISGNSAVTWLWNYPTSFWRDGTRVEVVGGSYLRTVHDGTVIDNLSHLINYEWL
ncbi:DUF3892 domain-containing protein [Mucilaginibacter ginsenosidivorans]|uniref:DUF3892 domain-containing protein n=1 Tax=Mucilaginibacter ginsenosidivorans TaxID=398053 RepID=A0A5B8UVZ0_9SPHI|nr:DUF3892 domain-containing protein [Mucilaginibacter ginsenosidivorans]QEC62501.1 DUF3892 domain-containing protein [Mucilaginibacter ginsenosidivorans]